jgi:actin-like ATPase involved in cell morphogenesis
VWSLSFATTAVKRKSSRSDKLQKKCSVELPATFRLFVRLKDGVIADFEVTQVMIKQFIAKAQQSKTLFRPRIMISIPYGITEVEKRAVKEAALVG